MDLTPDVIYFKDRKGRLILVNKAYAKGLGLKPGKVVGKTDFDIFPKKRAILMAKDDAYVMTTGKSIIDKIERSTRPDGVDNYVTTTKTPRYDDKRNIIGLIGITRDITPRMQLEHLKERESRVKKKLEILGELNKVKSEFVSVVSHELRTPLSITKHAITLIFDGIAGSVNPKQKELLIKAQNNIERLRKLIEDLLDISRIERGTFRLHYSLVNLNDLILDSSVYFKNLAKEKNLHLEYRLPKREINIFLDAERLNQILTNLINNAIKFTEQGGEIKVELKTLEDRVRIGVIDTGIGIAREELPKLFNKFTQLSKTSAARKKGIGLGLSIVKELIKKHGGEIWAESELGVGSKFYFTLPLFYSIYVLDKETRNRINELLDKAASLYLINLLIVNYKKVKKSFKIRGIDLLDNLKLIINNTLDEFKSLIEKKSKLIFTGFLKDTATIIIPEISEKEITKLCELFKDRIKRYFIENKIENIFINMGIIDIPKTEFTRASQISQGLHFKKIYIGLETRRLKRVSYQADLELIFAKDRIEPTYTLDISAGGICFITKERLKTDSILKLKLNLPAYKPLSLTGRIAWIDEIKKPAQEARRYKMGLEFTGLNKKHKKTIAKFIKSIPA